MKDFLFETYKVKRNIEDNPDDINDRLINTKDIISTRLMKKSKKIDDLIAIQREQDNMRDDVQLQGLKQVNEDLLRELVIRNPHLMSAVWKSVKENDIDKNGFMLCSELEDCFKEHYPAELEGKSLVFYFRKFSTDHDKNLINYRGIMKQIYSNTVILMSS